MTAIPYRRRRLTDDEVRLSYYAATHAHGAILFISLGPLAAKAFSTERVISHVVDTYKFDLRASDTKGVFIRRYTKRPNMSVSLGASLLEKEGLRLGPWLRSTTVQWMRTDCGIRIRLDPAASREPQPPPRRASATTEIEMPVARLEAIEKRLAQIEEALDQLKKDIAGTDIAVDEETVASAVETLRRAGYPTWQVGDRWNVGNTLLAPAAMVAMARRVASRAARR